MNLETPFITNIISGIIMCAFAIFIYFSSNRTKSALLFSLLTLLTSLWSIFICFTFIIDHIWVATILTKLNHFLGITIATIYLLFSYSYPNEKIISKNRVIILSIIEILFVFIIFFSDLIIGKAVSIEKHYIIWQYGTYWFIFHIYFLCCWIIGIFNLYKSYRKTADILIQKNIRFMLIAFSIGIIAPTVTSIIMPIMGIYDYYWMGPLSIFFWISLMTYSITQHRLFNIKIITIELAIFMLWIILLVRICGTEDTHSTIEEIGLLIISVIFGILLIRGTLHEIRQNERIEKLTNELHQAYMELKKKN